MKLLVVDVEATCWQGPPPPGQQSEIIEIGVCTLETDTGERTAPVSLLVRPSQSEVSAFCTELTTLTSALVATGCSFASACERLRNEYSSASLPWVSWGDYDRRQFRLQCERLEVSYPFSNLHLNAKALFARVYRLPQPVGMAGALRHLKLPLEGTHHRGADDAGNIAQVLFHTLRHALRGEVTEKGILSLYERMQCYGGVRP